MIKIYRYYMMAFLFFLMNSCSVDDLFDVKNNMNQTTPSTLADLQALLDNPETFNSYGTVLGEVASDSYFLLEVNQNQLIDAHKVAYVWSKEWAYISVIDWQTGTGMGSFGRIYQANLVLETLEKIDRSNAPAEYDNVKGQALFQRARSYFELAQQFCPYFEESVKGSKLGLPLREGTDVSIRSERSTLGQTYDFIEADLTKAASLLPNLPQFKTRASKCAALGLMARFNLVKGEYVLALKNATDALKIWSKLINYNELDYSDGLNPFIGYIDEVIFYSKLKEIISPETLIQVDSVLYASYDEDDLRKDVFYNYDSNSKLVFYKGSYCGRGYEAFFGGIATDELYLIKAECNIRNGNVKEGVKDVNSLLKNRWRGSYTDIQITNAEEALKLVIEERKKELIFRGVRWSDLRRLNKDSRFVQTLTRTLNGKTYTLEPNSNKYTLPFPDDVIEYSGMQQNPGW